MDSVVTQTDLIKEYNDMVEKYNMPTCECHGITFEKFVANYKTKEEKEEAEMKRFLLIASDDDYLIAGTGDWKGVYETFEEADAERKLLYAGHSYWYQIVDLAEVIATAVIPNEWRVVSNEPG